MASNVTSSLYSSGMKKGIGGLVSGLDTDSLVEQLTAGTQAKIDKQYQLQQKTVYQQEAYREAISKLVGFNNKYFSYTSKTNLLSSAFFKSSEVKSTNDDVKVTGNSDLIRKFSIKNIAEVAKSSSFASSKKLTTGEFSTGKVELEKDVSKLAGQSISLEYGGKNYTLSIDRDFEVDQTLSIEDQLKAVEAQLNKQINKEEDLKGNISYKAEGTLLTLENAGKKDIEITGIGKEISEALNIKEGSLGSSKEPVAAGDLMRKSKLADVLVDSTIGFEFNGVQKKFTFKKEDFLTAAEMTDVNSVTDEIAKKALINTYYEEAVKVMDIDQTRIVNAIQSKLNGAYGINKDGTNKVDVVSKNGKLSFSAKNDTDTFGINSMDFNLALHLDVKSTLYNRANKNDQIGKLDLYTPLDTLADGEKYKISINGVEFSFDKNSSINDILDTVNRDANAGVTLSYSNTTNTFSATSKETGENTRRNVEIKDVSGSGNLAKSLFGTEGTDYTIIEGTDAEITVEMNGVETTLKRSTNTISFDGINIELSNKAAVNANASKNLVDSGEVDASGNPIMIQKEVTFTVTENVDKISENISKFVDDYNELIKYLDEKIMESPNKKYPPLTEAQRNEMSKEEIEMWDAKAKAGMLYSDDQVTSVFYKLRNAMSNMVEGSEYSLSDIGISGVPYDYTGKLQFDKEKFAKAYAENPDSVSTLFSQNLANGSAKSKGVAYQLNGILNDYVGTAGEKGILVDRAGTKGTTKADKNFFSDRIKEYEKVMDNLKSKLKIEQERYWKQFTRLEQVMSNLNSQSSWLSQQFAQ